MQTHLLKIEDLNIYLKRKKGDLRIVSSLNIVLNAGETFSIVGESGSGKTLTALSIMGILPENMYSTGRIVFKGIDLITLSDEEMRRLRGKEISMVFQEPMTSLNPVLTVGYQIGEVFMTHTGMSRSEAIAKAIEVMRLVNIPSPEKRVKDYPHQLSGGLRQRVMIAMAIAMRPSLLIADEPTTALDVTIQAQILSLLWRLQEEYNLSMILITHDLGIVRQHSDRVAIMYAGTIMEMAQTEEIFMNPLHPYTIGLLNSVPELHEEIRQDQGLRPIPGFIPSLDALPLGCRFSERCLRASSVCMDDEPELEEISEGHYVRCYKAENVRVNTRNSMAFYQ